MLKGRGKGNWKGSQNPRLKKKSCSNIHTINDRGIHEILESFGGSSVAGGTFISAFLKYPLTSVMLKDLRMQISQLQMPKYLLGTLPK